MAGQVIQGQVCQALRLPPHGVAIGGTLEEQAPVTEGGQLPGVVQHLGQLGPAALLEEGKFLLREAGGLHHLRHDLHEDGEILGQALQRDNGGVIFGPGGQLRPHGLDVLGQLPLVAPGGAQGEEFGGPVGRPCLARGIGLGPPFYQAGETHPGDPLVFHPQQPKTVGETRLINGGRLSGHKYSFGLKYS